MSVALTQGAVPALMSADPGTDPAAQKPVLQVLSVKKVTAQNANAAQDRYRLILSDGEHFLQAMLATQLNHLVESKEIDKHTILKIDQFACNVVQTRKLVICLQVEIMSQQAEKIGNPVPFDSNSGGGGGTGSPAHAPPAAAPAPASAAQAGPSTRGGRGGGAAARGGRGGSAAGARGGAGTPVIYPIEGLSPYQNKWTIRARVTQKSDVKHWSNQRGEGKLFSVTLMDESGEIRATGFNDAVDDFYELLQEGSVYLISRARVTIAKKQFSNLSNEYEITFDRATEIQPCTDTTNVPEIKYNFVDLNNLESIPKDSTCDVLGVVTEIGETSQIVSKATQKPFSKRELTIVDRSQQSVRLTLWGKLAENFAHTDQPVIAFKGVKVSDFGGRSLSMLSSSTMNVNPDVPEAHGLRGWYDSEGQSTSFHAYTNTGSSAGAASFSPAETRTLTQVKDENLGMGDKPDYYNAKATVIYVKKENIAYPACPTDGKKVVEEGDGWRCEKCDKTYPECEWRYVISVSAQDHTGQLWLSGFNDIGQQLIGMTAGELMNIKNEDEAQYTNILSKAVGQTFNWNCRARQDTFNDNTRVRHQVTRASPVDFKAGTAALVKLCEEYEKLA